MNTKTAQRIIREVSPIYLGLVKPEAVTVPVKATRQNEVPGPSTIAELAEALRDPLPKKPAGPRCYSALEACATYKPLTLEMVRQLLAETKAARDEMLRQYTERTGQQVDYCDECELGVVEEEIEEGYGTRVVTSPCEACDGLGIIKV